jgi:hypothetical protein
VSDVWGQDALQAYAAQHGLTFEGEGLLPAATPFLRLGLGAGEHRAAVIVKDTAHSTSSVGGLGKKPERHTMNITRGRLPGGLEGLVCHHFHLELRTGSGDDGDSWYVVPHTVVFAYVPEAARVVRELRVVDGIWTADPPESPADVEELARGAAPLLSAAPYGTVVELRDGALCVAARGVIEEPAGLDQLCLLASALADGARRAAALHPPLDPTAPTRKQVLPPDLQWVEAIAAQIDWPQPPADVPTAQAAYAALAADDAESTGRTVSFAVMVVLVVVGVIWFSIDALLALAFHDHLAALIAAVVGVAAIPWAVSAARRTGREEAQSQVESRSKLPGLEAFVREYARSRGLVLEDRDEFRRRFASPIPGAPLKVMYGLLGAEVSGRLVLWMARDERWQMRYWNMAVVPAPPGDVPGVLPQFQVQRVGDALVVAEPVPYEGRSIERLDALRVTAVRAAGGVPPATGGVPALAE